MVGMIFVFSTGVGATENSRQKNSKVETTKKNDTLINPVNVDFSTTFSVEQVHASIMFFYETEFKFLVYPYNNKIIPYAQAYSDVEMKDLSFDFQLRDGIEKQLDKNTPVVIKGKIEGTNYGRLNIYDAVIVSEGQTPAITGFDLNQHQPDHVYNPRDLYNVLTAWEEKNITVTGLYQGYTQSNSLQQEVLERRIDLGPDFSTVIGCAFNTDPAVGDKLSAGVDRITIRGKISQVLAYGRPYMNDCELVK